MRTIKNLTAIALVSLSGVAIADTTANFQATASMNGTCTLSASDVNFGSLTPTINSSSLASASLMINALCSKDLPYHIKIGGGGSGDPMARRMTGATSGDVFAYDFYKGAGTRAPKAGEWNNYLTGTGEIQNLSLTAQAYLNQWVTPDNYSDTVTINISY